MTILFDMGESQLYNRECPPKRRYFHSLNHFATHAVIDERAPARSGIVLSLVNTGQEDGIPRASEILNLELNAELVTLSACQTGLGKVVRGKGMLG